MKERSLTRQIFAMSWPAALESLLIGVVDLVDTAMVSSLGLTAIASIAVTNQPKRILLMFIQALNVGATAVVSRRIGEGRLDEAKRAMHQFILACMMLAFVLYAGGIWLADPMMRLCGANEDTLADAVIYFQIVAVGQFLQAISLTINACLRAEGKTRVALVTSTSANVVNIIFDYLLIYGHFGFPRWGIMGDAVATSLGSLSALIISVWSVRKSSEKILHLEFRKQVWKFDKRVIGNGKKVVVSAFSEQFFHRMGLFFFTRLATSLGTAEFGLYQLVMNVANLQGYTYDGFSVTATTMTGQCLGANDPEKAEKATRRAVWMGYATAAAIGLIIAVFRSQILSLFITEEEAHMIVEGGPLMILVAISCIPCAGASTYAGALRGAGDTKAVAKQALWVVAFIRPILAWILCVPCRLYQIGIWIAFLVAYTLRWLLAWMRYRTKAWKDIKV